MIADCVEWNSQTPGRVLLRLSRASNETGSPAVATIPAFEVDQADLERLALACCECIALMLNQCHEPGKVKVVG